MLLEYGAEFYSYGHYWHCRRFLDVLVKLINAKALDQTTIARYLLHRLYQDQLLKLYFCR